MIISKRNLKSAFVGFGDWKELVVLHKDVEYVWNAFDQLTKVKTMAGTTVATYKYDENGRRIYSNVDRKETYYRYDGTSNRVLFEEDANTMK